MRAWALVALLVVPLAGCSDAPQGLARPTDVTVYPSVPVVTTPGRPVYNDSDPGYRVAAPLRVGDGWDYASNGSRPEYRAVRVVDSHPDGNRTLFLLRESFGFVGNAPSGRLSRTVEDANWSVLREQDDVGVTRVYEPGLPLRAYRNASFSYNLTTHDAFAGKTERQSALVLGFLEPAWETLSTPWGNERVVHAFHETFANRTRVGRVDTWFVLDRAMPLRYAEDGLGWSLVAYREGDAAKGTLMAV